MNKEMTEEDVNNLKRLASSSSLSDEERMDESRQLLRRSNSQDETETLYDIHSPVPDGSSLSRLNSIVSRIGMGKYQWALFALCGCGWIADNMWLQALSVVLERVQIEFNVSDDYSGFGTSCVMIGMTFGAIVWGALSDWMGRKPAFTMTLLITAVFGSMVAFSPNFIFYCTFLLLMGFGVGGNLPVDGALFLEFTPAANQSLLTLLSVFWPIGQVITSLFAWALIPRYSCPGKVPGDNCPMEENKGWRYTIFGLGMLTFLMLFGRIVLFSMLESPKYLLSRGRRDEAAHVLTKMAEYNGKEVLVTAADFGPDDTNDFEPKSSSHGSIFRTISKLFSRSLWLTTTLIWLIWMFVSIGYTMFHGFLPKFLSAGGDLYKPTINEIYRNYVIISLAGIPGSVIAMYSVDTRLGRKGTLALSTLGTAICLYLFTMFKSPNGQLIVSSLEACLANVMYGVIYSYSPEVFPTELRGTAVGLASALGRVLGIIAPILTGFLFRFGTQTPLFVSAAAIAVAEVCVLLLPIETRGRAAL